MEFRTRTLNQIAELICGNFAQDKSFFPYRSRSSLTAFFEDADTSFRHDGSTRYRWVAETLKAILSEPQTHPHFPPESFLRVISVLMDQGDALNEDSKRPGALAMLNGALTREGFEAFYGPDNKCYLKHTASSAIAMLSPNPHRPFTSAELQKREQLINYLELASEDHLIAQILLPLFRQLGFQRVTVAGHKDKALEYGKDVWMKFALPTQHVLYFGIQVKKGKLDTAGVSRSGNANVAEVYNQALMMLGHEIFDPEFNRRVLVDHAFIIAGGEITKSARNWIGNKLDTSKRSQIMFMDREDILNLFVVTNLALPDSAIKKSVSIDEIDLPF